MSENKKKAQMIIVLVILLIIAIGIFIFVYLLAPKINTNGKSSNNFCSSDIECVPTSCCHATSCVPLKNKPDCSGIFCTASCEPGTLDCGQGSCKCINKKCEAVFE